MIIESNLAAKISQRFEARTPGMETNRSPPVVTDDPPESQRWKNFDPTGGHRMFHRSSPVEIDTHHWSPILFQIVSPI